MFSVYLYKKLFPFLDSTTYPILLRCFHNYLPVTCYSTSSVSLVNVDLLLSTDKRNKSIQKLDLDKSFTVSYLINSFGFSRERALSISAKVHFNDAKKPNSVLALLHSYGFSDTQITAVVRKRPVILVAKENTILPKIKFFLSVGMSKTILAKFITTNPSWFDLSLDNSIIPNYNFLKSFLLTDERVITAIKQSPRVFRKNAEKRFTPNIEVLRELKVPQSSICLLLLHFPEALVVRSEEFNESVHKVVEMGFDPLQSIFAMALHAVTGKSNQATWDQCYETYSSWGWSKEDIYMAFRKQPNCMLMSRNKINRVMEFLVNKIGVNSRYIAQNPASIISSLEKKTIPRFSVVQVLLSKGLIMGFKLNTVLMPGEKYFLDKFVVPYEEEIPKLYDCYKGKVAVEDL